MDTFFISTQDWLQFVRSLAREMRVFYPAAHGDDYHLASAGPGECPPVGVSRYRAVQSMKPTLFEARLDVGGYLGGKEPPDAPDGPQAVIGVKGCDLRALAVLDFVLAGDVADPFYSRNRERTLVISSDCTAFKEVCFCTLVGGGPYPEGGYDLNLSPVDGGYLVHVGSPRGRALVEGAAGLFVEPAPAQREEASAARARVTALLEEHQRARGYLWGGTTKELMERVYESGVWEEEAGRCVECGACNFVCPTCHCFLLSDHGREKFRRLRNWDACQYKGFARVGGGSNPRPELYQRLRNRYEKKFHFCPVVIGVCGCTGCGRCVEACIGKIDMREVLKKLSGCK
jgi:ferredoxin